MKPIIPLFALLVTLFPGSALPQEGTQPQPLVTGSTQTEEEQSRQETETEECD